MISSRLSLARKNSTTTVTEVLVFFDCREEILASHESGHRMKRSRFRSEGEQSAPSSRNPLANRSSSMSASVGGRSIDGSGRVSCDMADPSGHESDGVEYDQSYPSARALQTRSRLQTHAIQHGGEGGEGHHRAQRSVSDGSISSTTSTVLDDGIDFLNDPPEQMTTGRRIALKLMDKKWYNPRTGSTDVPVPLVPEMAVEGESSAPSLRKAWVYFEHVVLTRYVVEDHNIDVDGWGWFAKFRQSFKNYDENFNLAQPGEKYKPTKLFDPIVTPHRQVRRRSQGLQCIHH